MPHTIDEIQTALRVAETEMAAAQQALAVASTEFRRRRDETLELRDELIRALQDERDHLIEQARTPRV